jgi:hypothetical protein
MGGVLPMTLAAYLLTLFCGFGIGYTFGRLRERWQRQDDDFKARMAAYSQKGTYETDKEHP